MTVDTNFSLQKNVSEAICAVRGLTTLTFAISIDTHMVAS